MKLDRLRFGFILVTIITLLGIFAPALSPESPNRMALKDRLEGPSRAHPLGRDQNGADILARLLYGARVSLTVAWAVVLSATSLGLIIGSIAGYRGGLTDQIIMRVVDMFYAFPGFLLALSLVAMLGPSLRNLVFALSLTAWTGFARLVRGEVLHLKTREHVMNARALGAAWPHLIIVHIWPNLASLVLVQATFTMAGTVIAESGLSFLGLGVPPATPTWGGLLNAGRRVLAEAPHVSLAPGLAILLLVLGFNLLGEGLSDRLDPRRARKGN